MTLNNIADSLGASLFAASFGQTERTRPSAAAGGDTVGQALDAASQRLDRQRSSTEVTLSAFGELRSSAAQLQQSSQTLADSESTSTPEEARAAAQNFVAAYNNAQTAANRVTSRENGALADNGRAQVAASQLSRTLDNGSQEQLRQIGINRNQDGTLSIDQQRFQQALQTNLQQVGNALTGAGRQVQESTTRQLDGNSQISRGIDTQTARASELQAQQQAFEQNRQDQIAQTQAQAQPANNNAADRINAVAAAGIAAYQRILSL